MRHSNVHPFIIGAFVLLAFVLVRRHTPELGSTTASRSSFALRPKGYSALGKLRRRHVVQSFDNVMDAEGGVGLGPPPLTSKNVFKGFYSNVLFNDEHYEPIRKMQAGVRKLAAVVGCTLGPRGRNVVVQRKAGTRPRIINDGVTIAKEVVLDDMLEEIGCQLVREASEKTNEEAGDGTTTAIVLSDAIITEGIKRVVSGVNAMQIYRGLSKTSEALVEYLEKELAVQVTDDQIEYVATISASGNEGIGNMIGTALKKVGRMGLITLEEGKNIEDVLETQDGMFLDECGYVSNKLINVPEDGIIQYQNARTIVVDGEINSIEEVIPILEIALAEDIPVFLIAHSYSKEVSNFFVLNHQRAGLQIAACSAPAFGDLRSAILEDIAILTGAIVLGEETDLGISPKDAQLEHLGTCVNVEVGKDGALIEGPDDTLPAIKARVEQLEIQRDTNQEMGAETYEREKFNRRIAKLQGGVGVIYVGAMTELELRDKKLRYDDALCAINAALAEGIVPGGATAFVRLAEKIDDIRPTLKPEEQKGADILQKALTYPLLLVARNAGKDPLLILDDVQQGIERGDPNFGWNAAKDEYGDMIEMGIIEPAKVIRCALENSVSIAKSFLLTDGVVIRHYLGDAKKERELGEITM